MGYIFGVLFLSKKKEIIFFFFYLASILADKTLDFTFNCLEFKNNYLKQTFTPFTKKETVRMKISNINMDFKVQFK